MRADPALLAAALAFVAADVFASMVAVRHDVAGEPLGVSIPVTGRTGLMVGWGAGIAAPWPMPAAALIAASRAGRGREGPAPGRVAVGLGLACIAGTLVEPVTYRGRAWTPAIRRAIAVNLVSSAALAAAGLRHVASSHVRSSTA